MKRFLIILGILLLAQASNGMALAEEKCAGVYGNGPEKFSLATGSPGELGLLKVLAETFCSKEKSTLCWVKAGSGDSLKLLKEKKVDMIMVHAPAAEKKVHRFCGLKRGPGDYPYLRKG